MHCRWWVWRGQWRLYRKRNLAFPQLQVTSSLVRWASLGRLECICRHSQRGWIYSKKSVCSTSGFTIRCWLNFPLSSGYFQYCGIAEVFFSCLWGLVPLSWAMAAAQFHVAAHSCLSPPALGHTLPWSRALRLHMACCFYEAEWPGCFPTGFGYQSIPNGIPEDVDRGRGRNNLGDKLHCVGGWRLRMASGRSRAMACYLWCAQIPVFSLRKMRKDTLNVPSVAEALLLVDKNPHKGDKFWMPQA